MVPSARSSVGAEYDVAFSYANEDWAYVDRVARAVQGRIRIFYDRHERVDLWGQELGTRLSDVYARRSRFCVIFISRHYAGKVWTNHERESAQARAFEAHQPYILPARFDDTTLPGVAPAVGYIDLRQMTPEEFGALLVEKVERAVAGERGRRMRPWLAALPIVLAAGLVVAWASSAQPPPSSPPIQEREDAGAPAAAPATRPKPCKECRNSKACGDSCIPFGSHCHKPPGCARQL